MAEQDIAKHKVAFFFGAGAEVVYGLPSGGEFALEIFRHISAEDKEQLREQIKAVKPTSNQINWFPDDLLNQRITVFGKTNFDSVIGSTLEARRADVVKAILNFDSYAERVKSEFQNLNVEIDSVLNELGCDPGTVTYAKEIVLNKSLTGQDSEGLFGSEYFSAYIEIIKKKTLAETSQKNIAMLVRSVIELLIGALGQNLINSLNNTIFEKAPEELSLFDDIGGIFSLDFRRVGLDALEHLLKEKTFSERTEKIQAKKTDQSFIAYEFFLRTFELIFSSVADYQTLVDSHYSYLYQPRKEWGKFCKITTFLFTVHRYMTTALNASKNIKGYYEDIEAAVKLDIKAIATSNYTNLVGKTNFKDVFYLNGKLSDWYDPYKNEIVDESTKAFKVPLLFTQSGTKPLTSISMSRRYIDFYDKTKECEYLVVVGYGFNADDGHINTLLRSLVDDEGKKLIVLDYNCSDIKSRKKQIEYSLRCDNRSNIHIFSVNGERKINNKPWLEAIFERI